MSRPEYLQVKNQDLTVRLDLFKVGRVMPAFIRVALDRFYFRFFSPQLQFFRLLGTGTGQTFTSKDADLHRWVVLTVWQTEAAAISFSNSRIFNRWQKIANETATFFLAPLSSKGEWANCKPFGEPTPHRWDGPVLSITRAKIKLRMWRKFQSEVPPVSKSLHLSAGLLTAFGIGEAPVGLQGTVSIWLDNRSLTEFAQRKQPHREVIAMTHELDWYREELFARFAITSVAGELNGVALAQVIPTS